MEDWRVERGGEGGEGRGEEAFLVMWPRRLCALNPPLYIVVINRRGQDTVSESLKNRYHAG